MKFSETRFYKGLPYCCVKTLGLVDPDKEVNDGNDIFCRFSCNNILTLKNNVWVLSNRRTLVYIQKSDDPYYHTIPMQKILSQRNENE